MPSIWIYMLDACSSDEVGINIDILWKLYNRSLSIAHNCRQIHNDIHSNVDNDDDDDDKTGDRRNV